MNTTEKLSLAFCVPMYTIYVTVVLVFLTDLMRFCLSFFYLFIFFGVSLSHYSLRHLPNSLIYSANIVSSLMQYKLLGLSVEDKTTCLNGLV